jgi:hypothetical protein
MIENHKQVEKPNDSFSQCILWGHRTFLSGNANLVIYPQDGPDPVISKPGVSDHDAISNELAIHNVSDDPTKVAKYENSSKPEFEISTRVAKHEYANHLAPSFNKLHSLAVVSPPLVKPSKYEDVYQLSLKYKTDTASERHKNKSSGCALVTPSMSRLQCLQSHPREGITRHHAHNPELSSHAHVLASAIIC